MGYTLTAVVGDGDAELPWSPVELSQGFRMWPLWETRVDHLYEVAGPGEVLAGFIYLRDSLATALPALAGSAAAWIEAEFFGGVGEQAAIGWDRAGHQVGPITGVRARGEPGAIDVVLHHLGVTLGGALDEFAALGLDRHREVDDWLEPTATEVVALLRSVDHPERTEEPEGFDAHAAEQRLLQLRDLLTRRFGGEPDGEWGGPSIQDASHFGLLVVPKELVPEGVRLWVRVSRWGDLATFGAENPGVLDHNQLRRAIPTTYMGVRDDLDVAGYRYVPEWTLMSTAYGGDNMAIRNLYAGREVSWWTRYFDYL